MKMAFRSLILLLTIVQAESAISNSSPIFGPKQVTGLVGGSVTVKCFYPRTSVNRHSRKYWCKESTQHCSTIISSNGYVARGFEGRTSIIDYPENGLFTIEISNLVRRDMGPYKCGVGLNDKGLSFRVKLDVSAGSILPEEAQLFYAEQHGSVTITCAFGARASGRNYLCKMTKYTCVNIIDTDGNIDQFYKGRVLLSNLQISGSFNIIMTQLQKQDSGLYLCGTGNYGAEGETKKLDIHVYEEVLVSKQQPILNGVQGGSVSVECHYEPKENTTIKSWCKWKENECTVLINNLGDVRDDYEGRIVMHNSPENGTYTIILNQLHNGDEGFYWCMTSGEQERISSTELKIVQETGQPSLSVDNEIHAVAGSPLTITCTYPCKYADYEKYWCKWKNTGCEPLIASEESQAGLVVSCDKGSRILSLNFDQTSLSDQGWYWCGVRKGGHYGETYATYLQVQGVLRNAEEPSRPNEEPSDVVSQNRNIPLNNANKKVNDDIPADSHKESKHSTILLSVLLPLGIILVLLATAFFVVKFRLFKHSDLVSVGSYRTHISMTDFENARQYGAKDNVCMAEAHETQIGDKDDYNITTSSPKEAGKSKKAKRNSKEDVDMVYTTFLLNSENIPPRGSQQQ